MSHLTVCKISTAAKEVLWLKETSFGLKFYLGFFFLFCCSGSALLYSVKSVLTEIKTREIKEETHKNATNQFEFNLRKGQRTRSDWIYFQCPQLRCCCRVCCSCSYSESPRRLFSKMLCDFRHCSNPFDAGAVGKHPLFVTQANP